MGVGRGQPHPLCQLGGGGPPFSFSPLEITDHDGLEKEKKESPTKCVFTRHETFLLSDCTCVRYLPH